MCFKMKEAAGFTLETGHGFSHYAGGAASQGHAEVRVFNPGRPFAISLSTRRLPQKNTHCDGSRGSSHEPVGRHFDGPFINVSRSHATPPPTQRHTADGRHAHSGSAT